MSLQPSVALAVGDRVRVTSRRRSEKWVRKGYVEKISVPVLIAYVRFADESAEWIEMSQIEVLAP